jgi:O-methyltransferase domain
VLKHIMRDWDDSNALQILRNVRAAMSGGEKLLVIEGVVPDDDREHLSKMLAATGTERTADEGADLARAASFRDARVIPTSGPMSIVGSEAA